MKNKTRNIYKIANKQRNADLDNTYLEMSKRIFSKRTFPTKPVEPVRRRVFPASDLRILTPPPPSMFVQLTIRYFHLRNSKFKATHEEVNWHGSRKVVYDQLRRLHEITKERDICC